MLYVQLLPAPVPPMTRMLRGLSSSPLRRLARRLGSTTSQYCCVRVMLLSESSRSLKRTASSWVAHLALPCSWPALLFPLRFMAR